MFGYFVNTLEHSCCTNPYNHLCLTLHIHFKLIVILINQLYYFPFLLPYIRDLPPSSMYHTPPSLHSFFPPSILLRFIRMLSYSSMSHRTPLPHPPPPLPRPHNYNQKKPNRRSASSTDRWQLSTIGDRDQSTARNGTHPVFAHVFGGPGQGGDGGVRGGLERFDQRRSNYLSGCAEAKRKHVRRNIFHAMHL